MKHSIVVTILGNEVVIVCDTCEDEIGAKPYAVALDEINDCVDIHVNGPPNND